MADSGTYDQSTLTRRQKIAEQMLAESSKPQKIEHWAQGLAQLGNIGADSYRLNQLDKRAEAVRAQDTAALMSVLGGGSPAPAASGAAQPALAPPPAPSSPGSASPDMSVPRGIRNNNPLNIEAGDFTRGQPGFTGSDGRFARFEKPEQGTDAASNLLDVYANKHKLNTVGGIVNRWAPPSDNNPSQAYAASVAGRMGVAPDAPLDMANPDIKRQIISAMGQFENGRPIPGTGSSQPVPSNQVAGPGAPSGQPPTGGPPTPNVPPSTAVAQAMGGAPAAAPVPPASTPGGIPDKQKRDIARLLNTTPGSPAHTMGMSVLTKAVTKEKEDVVPMSPEERQKWQVPSGMSAGIDRNTGKPVFSPASTNVAVTSVADPIAAGVGKQFDEGLKNARTASREVIPIIHDARTQLDNGAFAGSAANLQLGLQKIGSVFGMDNKTAANTETFRATIGRQVLAHAKQLGANPSNADRDFIREVEGGSGTMEEATLRRLLDLSEKYARNSIRNHNADAERLLKVQPDAYKGVAPLLSVEDPPEYKSPVKTAPVAPVAATAGKVRKFNLETGSFE